MPKKRNAKRTDGRIPVQVYLGMVDGKRRYKTVYGKTQKEADEKALQVKLALKKGIDVTAERDTFGQWIERFLAIKKSSGISNSQINCYKNYCRILSSLNDIPISQVRAGDIQDIINELAEYNPHTHKPTAKMTMVAVKGAARQIFDLAIEARVLEYNPATAVRISRNAPQYHRRALMDEEQQWICDTPHRAQRAAMIMMYAGLRRGELMALTWNDVDLKKKTISINKSVEMIGGRPHVKSPKTEAGKRTIDIPQRLADFLTPLKEADLKENPNILPNNILVCHSITGEMFTNSAWQVMWNSYQYELNLKYGKFKTKHKRFQHGKLPMMIPAITAHWLRHTFATLLYLSGVDVLTARDQLGHTDIQTTLGIYTHLDKVYKRKSMSRLDDYLNQKDKPNNQCKSDASQAI